MAASNAEVQIEVAAGNDVGSFDLPDQEEDFERRIADDGALGVAVGPDAPRSLYEANAERARTTVRKLKKKKTAKAQKAVVGHDAEGLLNGLDSNICEDGGAPNPSCRSLRGTVVEEKEEEQEEEEADEGWKPLRNSRYSGVIEVQDAIAPGVEGNGHREELESRMRTAWTYFSVYFQRLHVLNVQHVKLMAWEYDKLVNDLGLGGRPAQVLCWRRSMLEIASVFFLLNLCFRLHAFILKVVNDTESLEQGIVDGNDVGDYKRHFHSYIGREWAFDCMNIILPFCGIAYCVRSTRTMWTKFRKTSKSAAIAYVITFFGPVIGLFLIDFKQGVDFAGIREQLCEELVDGSLTGNWTIAKVLNTTFVKQMLPAEVFESEYFVEISQQGLRGWLASEFDVHLPDNTCELHDTEIMDALKQAAEASGRYAPAENASCRAANQTAALRMAISGNSSIPSLDQWIPLLDVAQLSEPAELAEVTAYCKAAPCNVCGQEICIAELVSMQSALTLALSATVAGMERKMLLQNNTALKSGDLAQSLVKLGFEHVVATSCGACIEPVQLGSDTAMAKWAEGYPQSCATICLPIWEAESRIADAVPTYAAHRNVSKEFVLNVTAAFEDARRYGRLVQKASQAMAITEVCITQEHLRTLGAATRIAKMTTPWKMLFGLKFAVRAVGMLLPQQLAMMLGAFKGACIVKNMLPYSRVPGVILFCAVVFSISLVMFLLIVVLQAIGNIMMRLAFACFIIANVVYLPWEFLFPGAHKPKEKLWFRTYKAPWRLLEPLSHAEAEKAIDNRQTVAQRSYLIMCVFLLVWAWQTGLDTMIELHDFGMLELSLEDLKAAFFSKTMWTFAGFQGVKAIASFYGIAKLSTVFFADACLMLVALVDEVDIIDSNNDNREAHKALFQEVHSAFWGDFFDRLHALLKSEEQDVFVVRGADADAEEINGAWFDVGEYNGKPKYMNSAGCVILWGNSEGSSNTYNWGVEGRGAPDQSAWVAILTSRHHVYYNVVDSSSAPTGGWIPLDGLAAGRLELTYTQAGKIEVLRRELQELKISGLARRAREAGITQPEIDLLLDACDRKSALIDAIVKEEVQTLEDVEDLHKLSMSALLKLARCLGLTTQQLDDCLDSSAPKDAVIRLVLDQEPDEEGGMPDHQPLAQPDDRAHLGHGKSKSRGVGANHSKYTSVDAQGVPCRAAVAKTPLRELALQPERAKAALRRVHSKLRSADALRRDGGSAPRTRDMDKQPDLFGRADVIGAGQKTRALERRPLATE